MSCLVSCGVGVISPNGSDDQQLGSNQNAEQPKAPTPPSNPTGGNVCIEGGCAPADAGTPPPPPSNGCPMGQTPVYRYVADSQTNPTYERLIPGPGGAPMTMTCETTTCAVDQVEVIESGGLRLGMDPKDSNGDGTGTEADLCVPPPPSCGAGLFANYIPPTQTYDGTGTMTAGGWTCTGSCDVLIQYGGMFGMRLVCAPPPPTTCGAGTEPQFDVGTETWGCLPACNGGTYDPATFSGMDVCVPC
ncbi:MAG: hypothetical protein QM723_22850 [Myxococcaceae bacterium]